MKIAILGGSGFIGQKLAAALLNKGDLKGQKITGIKLCDMSAPMDELSANPLIEYFNFNICSKDSVDQAIEEDCDVIFHLASIVSGQAEADMKLGYEVNLDGMRHVLSRCSELKNPPIVVFSSSIAVYGSDTPQPIEDHFIRSPRSSYGTQKAICELLLNDFSRKGIIDGRGLRLPTITVRPGKPNAAASSFLSSIIREPLAGEKAICPVTDDYKHWFSSPRTIIKNIIHAAEINGADMGDDRCIALPGVSTTVREMLDALRRVAGDKVADLVEFKRDPVIEKIVWTWVEDFRPNKALSLGFHQDGAFDEFIKAHIEDELS